MRRPYLSYGSGEVEGRAALIVYLTIVLSLGGILCWLAWVVFGEDDKAAQISALEALSEVDPEADAATEMAAGVVYFKSVVTEDGSGERIEYPGLRPFHQIVHGRYEVRPIDLRSAKGTHPEYQRLVTEAMEYAERFNIAMLEPRREEAQRLLDQYYRQKYPERFGT